ncbi:LysR substrate-binding domain-containing protein (plasmid) [Paraburkholderia sp. PREW-6R]|uniref:LysR substrate-binding domain-containing protein n=1 Tax=Paraburkholderia sp. PREW-6R TaxID=3141544 RepID=UPI0031F5BAFE
MRSTPSLRHIEAFRAVMLTGTVVGAANLMSVTQPAVSRTIALLELQLGFKLFARRGRRLLPTVEAQTLFREVEKVYVGAERIGQVAQDIRFQRAGALRVATLPAFALSVMPRALQAFLALRPSVTTTVHSLPSRQIAELVSTGQFDVGLVELPISRAAITIEALPPVEAAVIMPPEHRLAAQERVHISDLDGERMVMLSQHSYVRYQIDDAFSEASASANVIAETHSSLVAAGLVAAGIGISILSALTIESFDVSKVIARPLKGGPVSRYAIIFPDVAPPSSLARAFAMEVSNQMMKD